MRLGVLLKKATAAQENKKTLFLLPKENSELVQYTTKRTSYGGLVLVERVPERISAQDYIRKNVGIRCHYR